MGCYVTKSGMFLCGKLGPRCADCYSVAGNLCDYPIKKNKTCNRKICERHSHEIRPNHHYCSAHFQEYTAQAANGSQVFVGDVFGANEE